MGSIVKLVVILALAVVGIIVAPIAIGVLAALGPIALGCFAIIFPILAVGAIIGYLFKRKE